MKEMVGKKKINWAEVVWVVLLIGICFALMFTNRALPFFASDEGDYFLGGKMVANGLDVYKEFASQHMPVMYYVCAIFYLLGARSVIQFRLMFYGFLCLLWIAMYIRYRKKFGVITMSLYPLLYICVMRFMDFGYCVLSEQLWAQGLVILLLEYLLYIKEKKVSLPSACWISFSIFISFGSAFMAAASIGIIFLGVLYSEIFMQCKKKSKFNQAIGSIWRRNWKLVIIILLPFAVLITWYLISGNLYHAYYGSYVVNREFYPKYLGTISSAGGTLFQSLKLVKDWIWYTEYTEIYFQIMVVLIFVLKLVWNRKYSVATCVFFYTTFAAIRGIDNFHAIQFHAVIMIMFAILVGEFASKYYFPKIKNYNLRDQILALGCFVIALGLICFPFYRSYYESKGRIRIIEGESVDALPEGYDVIDRLTDDNEKILECILNPWYYFSTNTLPVTTSPVCPWIYEAHHDRILEDIKREKPRVISYSEDVVIWGYRFGDFATDICEYFKENYTLLDGYTQVYVRNDYYEEAMKILGQ